MACQLIREGDLKKKKVKGRWQVGVARRLAKILRQNSKLIIKLIKREHISILLCKAQWDRVRENLTSEISLTRVKSVYLL